MTFEEAYLEFISFHCERREGERLRRVEGGLGHAEKLFLEQVWWPSFGQFYNLHAEYEVYDFKDGTRYLDFAYIRPFFRVAFEIDGYGPHHKNLSRWQFADQLQRQNHLVIDGWKVIRFSADDLREKPRECQQTLQQLMGRWLGNEQVAGEATPMEKEVIRLAMRLCRPITPADVCQVMGMNTKTARIMLHNLTAKKWLEPASGQIRVRTYRLALERKNYLL